MASLGKWIPGVPGVFSNGHGYNFYCAACERGFAIKTSFDKHLTTELHFKRTVKSQQVLYKNNYEDKLVDRLPSRRSCRLHGTKNYVSHSKSHKVSNTIRCPTCFAHLTRDMLGKHLLSYFHCQKIESKGRRVEPEKSLILDNIHQIIVQSPYQCKACKFYFTHPAELLNHFQLYHIAKIGENKLENSTTNRWNCSACKIPYLSPMDMFRHLSSSEHEKMEVTIQKSIPIIIREVNMHTCSFCFKTFLLRRGLLSHQKMCKKFIGNMCKKKTVSLNTNLESFKIMIPEPKPFAGVMEYTCSTCLYTCQSVAHLKRHEIIHDIHRTKRFACSTCGAAFFEMFQLNFHQKIHDGKTVKCTYQGCQYVGRCNSEIKTHAVCHSGVNDIMKCDSCDYTTRSKSHLKRHVKLVHQRERKLKCNVCPFETALTQSLKRHELLHAGARPFNCPYNCGYSARSIENLRVHVLKRKVHAGAVMYTCQCCVEDGHGKGTIFKTNTFSEFKLHVTKEHVDYSKSKTDIFVIAGIRQNIL